MALTPGLRKLALTVHVTSSVGWLGAVACFLALAIVGSTDSAPELVRSVYLVMEPIGWSVLVPLSLVSLLSGVVQSLAGTWGLLRHYWVVAKLVINLLATIVLLMYMPTLSHIGDLASQATFSTADLGELTHSPTIHSAGALALLLVATTLSVYKPRGLTRYGWRKQRRERDAAIRPG